MTNFQSNGQIQPPLVPKCGNTLKVLAICRVSDPRAGKQDERSLGDQETLHRRWLELNTDCPIELKVISGVGSGELLDRDELRQAEDEIETGYYDLVLAEDLGRICRRIDAFKICEIAEDNDCRLIGLNDHVDTLNDNWRLCAFFAVLHHEIHNSDASKRIKRTHRNRFTHGGVCQTFQYGYVKPPGAKTDDEVQKDPSAEAIYLKWFEILRSGGSFSEVADWLNANGVPVGIWCRSNSWTPQMVARCTYNPILKGVRQRNNRISKRINKTGRRKSVKAPDSELLERHCLHLAIFDADYYDSVIRILRDRNEKFRRGRQRAQDSRQGVPKRRTVWPGQSIKCGICQNMLYYGAHGRNDHLVCSGAIQYRCWNAVGISGPKTSSRICDAIWNEIESLEGFDASMVDSLNRSFAERVGTFEHRLTEIATSLNRINRERQNILQAIKDGNPPQLLMKELSDMDAEEQEMKAERQRLCAAINASPSFPPIEDLKASCKKIFSELPRDSAEFGRLMNQLIRSFTVHPVQLIDGGHVVLRARLTFCLTSLCEQPGMDYILATECLEREIVVDLFDPPQRVSLLRPLEHIQNECREADVRMTERQIAGKLGVTQPAVQRAKKLQKLLERSGAYDPYVELVEPPKNDSKLKRHLHPRFNFKKSDGD